MCMDVATGLHPASSQLPSPLSPPLRLCTIHNLRDAFVMQDAAMVSHLARRSPRALLMPHPLNPGLSRLHIGLRIVDGFIVFRGALNGGWISSARPPRDLDAPELNAPALCSTLRFRRQGTQQPTWVALELARGLLLLRRVRVCMRSWAVGTRRVCRMDERHANATSRRPNL